MDSYRSSAWIPKGSDAFHSWVATDQGSDTVGHRVPTHTVNVVQVLRVLESQRPVKIPYSRFLHSSTNFHMNSRYGWLSDIEVHIHVGLGFLGTEIQVRSSLLIPKELTSLQGPHWSFSFTKCKESICEAVEFFQIQVQF